MVDVVDFLLPVAPAACMAVIRSCLSSAASLSCDAIASADGARLRFDAMGLLLLRPAGDTDAAELAAAGALLGEAPAAAAAAGREEPFESTADEEGEEAA